MFHIGEVEFQLLAHNKTHIKLFCVVTLEKRFLIPEKDLTNPRYPGLHGQHQPLFVGIQVDIPRGFRPRANEAHLSAKNIIELGNFIQLPFTEEFTDLCDASITAPG